MAATITLKINGKSFPAASTAELRRGLSTPTSQQYREIWLSCEAGHAVCALLNGKRGFLMYLRGEGDAGLTSRDPSFAENADKFIAYKLSNGQLDEYPTSWALNERSLLLALEYFIEHQKPAPFIVWHDDSA